MLLGGSPYDFPLRRVIALYSVRLSHGDYTAISGSNELPNFLVAAALADGTALSDLAASFALSSSLKAGPMGPTKTFCPCQGWAYGTEAPVDLRDNLWHYGGLPCSASSQGAAVVPFFAEKYLPEVARGKPRPCRLRFLIWIGMEGRMGLETKCNLGGRLRKVTNLAKDSVSCDRRHFQLCNRYSLCA